MWLVAGNHCLEFGRNSRKLNHVKPLKQLFGLIKRMFSDLFLTSKCS